MLFIEVVVADRFHCILAHEICIVLTVSEDKTKRWIE